MILLIHLIVGALIGQKISNPVFAISLAFLSHYLLDIIPHVEYPIENIRDKQWSKSLPDFLRVFLDFCLGMLIIFIFLDNRPIIFVAAFFAVFPDLLNILNLIFKNKLLQIHSDFHEKNHFLKYKKISNLWRILSQIIVIIICIFILKI